MLGALRAFGRTDDTVPRADVGETAEMLVVRPELVALDKVERGFVGEVDLPALQEHVLSAFAPNGILGDPTGATAEMGVAVLEALVELLDSAAR